MDPGNWKVMLEEVVPRVSQERVIANVGSQERVTANFGSKRKDKIVWFQDSENCKVLDD